MFNYSSRDFFPGKTSFRAKDKPSPSLSDYLAPLQPFNNLSLLWTVDRELIWVNLSAALYNFQQIAIRLWMYYLLHNSINNQSRPLN